MPFLAEENASFFKRRGRRSKTSYERHAIQKKLFAKDSEGMVPWEGKKEKLSGAARSRGGEETEKKRVPVSGG